MIKTAADQFISAKLKNAKSVKNNMTNQQQNFDDIIDSFNMFDMSNLLNQVSLNEVSLSEFKLPAFYQYLNHSHINIQT